MRGFLPPFLLAAAGLLAAPLPTPSALRAQAAPAPATATPATAAPAATRPAQRTAPGARVSDEKQEKLRDRVAAVRRDPNATPLPPNEQITVGARTVPAGSRVEGTVATAQGRLDVFGQVGGDAVAIDGDVVIHPGALVEGNAFSVGGEVRAEGGMVLGELRTLQGAVGALPAATTEAPRMSTSRALKLAAAWLAVLIVIGIGVLVAAGEYLDGVIHTLERSFSRAFAIGIAGQLAALPVLVLGVVALAITVLGILLIPFAVVAFALALAGLITLGFLGVASVTGRWIRPVPRGAIISERGAALRALVFGICAYLALWVVAAAFTWHPLAGGLLRAIAFAITWVATTAGLGAAILSRAGSRREAPPLAPAAPPDEELSWMTPTPVTGVVAARRPTPVSLREPR